MPSQPPSYSVSSVEVPSQPLNSANSVDNASAHLPNVQFTNSLDRRTADIIIPPFCAMRKRRLSTPLNVVRNNHVVKQLLLPSVESFSDKRRRLDHIYVRTVFSPATDAPT